MDGSAGPQARKYASEAKALGDTLDVPVVLYDERLTTVSAHQVLREQGVAGPDRRDTVDMVAAAILLQAWLDRRRAALSTPPDDD